MAEKRRDIFGKAKATVDGIGSKVGKSLTDIKDTAASAAEKGAAEVKKQSKKTKDAIEAKTKEVKATKEPKEKHTIVQLAGTKAKILLPDGYERLKYKNLVKDAAKAVANTDAAYRKTVGNSDNIVMITKTTSDKAMNPEDVQGLINGIHECLADNQGIIEARNGVTAREYKYIYSIVKNLSEEQFGGVRYFLRLNLFHENDIIEIQADFTEIGTTGGREAICSDLARRAGLADIFADGFKDWAKDPYDPEYTKGCLKNLAEKEGLDGLFPENPLSQAHEFLLAVLRDEFVTVRQESDEADEDAEDAESDSEVSPEERAEKEKEFLLGIFVDECRRYTYPVEVEKKNEKKDSAGKPEKQRKEKPEKTVWYGIGAVEDREDGWGDSSDKIVSAALEMGLKIGFMQMQGNHLLYLNCTKSEIEGLAKVLGEDKYGYGEVDKAMLHLIKKNINWYKPTTDETNDSENQDKEEKKKRDKLDDQLKAAVTNYNASYTILNDHGTKLFNQRERALDLLENVENLINSIANHPKEFDADISEIKVKKQEFRDACDFAKEELAAAQKSAAGAGAGVAGGMAAGQAFLAMTGPIGWSIAGATLLTSIVLFANKKIKLDKEKKEEIEAVLKNTEQLQEADAKLDSLLNKTIEIREGLGDQYTQAMRCFGRNFLEIGEDDQMLLGAIVNNAKALAVSLDEGI